MPSTLVLDRALARSVPESFGRYQLLAQIGMGGMAEVFLARVGELDGLRSLLAVKRTLPGCADDPAFGSLFEREARIALRLQHRGIVRVIEVGKVEGAWFLAMELVQGETVSRVQKAETASNRPAASAMIAHAGAELALALHHVHSLTDGRGNPLGVVHRDVSPQNVMLGFDGAVKLIDFGVARANGSRNLTVAGQFRGKLPYGAPEQVEGRALDARTDVFALGVVLHEWLAGRRLFHAKSAREVIDAVLHAPAPPLTGVPRDLAGIVEKALEKDPDRRFQTAEAMAHALLEVQVGQPGEESKTIGAHVRSLFPARFDRWRLIVQRETGEEQDRAHNDDADTGPLPGREVTAGHATVLIKGPPKNGRGNSSAPLRTPRLPPPRRSSTLSARVAQRDVVEPLGRVASTPISTEVSGLLRIVRRAASPFERMKAHLAGRNRVLVGIALGSLCLLVGGSLLAIRAHTPRTTRHLVSLAPASSPQLPIVKSLETVAVVKPLATAPRPPAIRALTPPPALVPAAPAAPVSVVPAPAARAAPSASARRPPVPAPDVRVASVRRPGPPLRRPPARRTTGHASVPASPAPASPPPPPPSILNELEPSPYRAPN